MHVIACNEIYYIVLQFHYMSLHRGGFADAMTGDGVKSVTSLPRPPARPGGRYHDES